MDPRNKIRFLSVFEVASDDVCLSLQTFRRAVESFQTTDLRCFANLSLR